MTVLIQPYTENAIKQIIRDNKNNFSAPSPSRPKKSFFPLQEQLDDLRQELIQFTVFNSLSITSALHLGERYEDHLNDLLDEFKEEGATFDLLNDLVKEAFAEGVLQRTKKEDERRIRAAEAMIDDARLYLSVRPNMTYEELLTSTMFQQNLRSAGVPKPICEQLLRDALAQKPFIYPDEAEAEANEEEDQKPEEKKPTSILDEEDAGTIEIYHPEKPTALSVVSTVKETTFPPEAPEIRVAVVEASEPVEAPIPDMTVPPPVREEVSLSPVKPKKITRATVWANDIKDRIVQSLITVHALTPDHWCSVEEVITFLPQEHIPHSTMRDYLEDLRTQGRLQRKTEYQRLDVGKSTKRYRYKVSATTTNPRQPVSATTVK